MWSKDSVAESEHQGLLAGYSEQSSLNRIDSPFNGSPLNDCATYDRTKKAAEGADTECCSIFGSVAGPVELAVLESTRSRARRGLDGRSLWPGYLLGIISKTTSALSLKIHLSITACIKTNWIIRKDLLIDLFCFPFTESEARRGRKSRGLSERFSVSIDLRARWVDPKRSLSQTFVRRILP